MVHSVRYSARALAALEHIDQYLMERSPGGAANVFADIKRSIDLLAAFPLMGSAITELDLRYHLTRRYRYRIVYRVTETTTEIRDVLHPRQQGPG
jgi:plasmid stabilization system protein ParE